MNSSEAAKMAQRFQAAGEDLIEMNRRGVEVLRSLHRANSDLSPVHFIDGWFFAQNSGAGRVLVVYKTDRDVTQFAASGRSNIIAGAIVHRLAEEGVCPVNDSVEVFFESDESIQNRWGGDYDRRMDDV